MTSPRVERLPAALRADIDACGYFPDLVAEALALAVGDEEVRNHVVHHEATFTREEIQRHLSALVLTPVRLIVAHTDESEAQGEPNQAFTTTESIPFGRINSVSLTQVVSHPERYGTRRSVLAETWLTVNWGTVRRVELEPAHCGDPNCDADHGYSGSVSADDLTVRMSATADGPGNVERLVAFTTELQLVTGQAR